MIGAVILAAGESKRMGRPKMLLPFGMSTIVETVARATLASVADRVVVVVGAGKESIMEALVHLPVAFAVNPDFHLGMLSSIQCGIRALPPTAEAAVIMLGDQPTVSTEVVDRVIEAWRSSDKGLVIPTYEGRRGHPLLMDLRYREEVLGLDLSAGLRALLAAHGADILEVPVDASAILEDIDTPEDYDQLASGNSGH